MYCHHWSTSENSYKIRIFCSCESGNDLLPKGKTNFVEPDFNGKLDIRLIKAKLDGIRLYLTDSEIAWRVEFLNDYSSMFQEADSVTWYLDEIPPLSSCECSQEPEPVTKFGLRCSSLWAKKGKCQKNIQVHKTKRHEENQTIVKEILDWWDI